MSEALHLQADVLVLGGGMAGAWAAVAAARAGARVVLTDKGYCGTSGVTAAAGPGHWWVPEAERDAAVAQRHRATLGLADPAWMRRILDTTWAELPGLAPWYRFSANDQGELQYRAVRGPEYMRALRQRVEQAGVTVLDHSPALELLLHADGSVAGARGLQRQPRPGRDWEVRAPAVVLATGGCAFMSWLIGSRNNTGDGHLMAAEVGVPLADMEFGNAYCMAQAHTGMARAAFYAYATCYDAQGHELPLETIASGDLLVQAMLKGPVSASLHRMPADLRAIYPQISPNVLLPFIGQGIDPYTQRFALTLQAEGTVRGTGGLQVADADCQTRVPGLYAAGDVASRGLVAGAATGGGAVNASWALSSGIWSGTAAAGRARSAGRYATGADRPVLAAGEAGLRPLLDRLRGGVPRNGPAALVRLVQQEMLPPQKNWQRSGPGLAASAQALDEAWLVLRHGLRGEAGDGRSRQRAREAAALVAMSRWALRAALARTESRGLHRRSDHPQAEARWQHRLEVSGLDTVRTGRLPATGAPGAARDAVATAPAQPTLSQSTPVQAHSPALAAHTP